MNTEDKYLAWTRSRQTLDAGTGFTDSVMLRVRELESQAPQQTGAGRRFLVWMSAHPLAQAAVILLTTALAMLQGALLIRVGIG